MLKSKDSFALEVKVAMGEVLVNIGLDPVNIESQPLWSLSQSTGTGVLEVATDNPNFYMAT